MHRQFILSPGSVRAELLVQLFLQSANLIVVPVCGSQRVFQFLQTTGD
jgi:hypothetical protein